MFDLGSEAIIASGSQEDVAGQGKRDSAAKHQSFLLKYNLSSSTYYYQLQICSKFMQVPIEAV